MKKIDYKKGSLFGNLTFIEEVSTKDLTKRKASFKCFCGSIFEAQITNIKNGHTSSCGCKKTRNRDTEHPDYILYGNKKKTCSYCKEAKKVEEFNGSHANRLGRASRCKVCQALYKKARLSISREQAALRMTNSEYSKHVRKRDRKWRRENPLLHIYRAAKSRAKRNKIEFNIEHRDIIIPDKCPLLGVPFIAGTKGVYKYAVSLDRIDNSKGYIVGNVGVISTLANSMKNSATKEELESFAKNILTYLEG